MAYTMPDLPYPYEALEPPIDSETTRLHHDKHHKAYVDKLNAALEGTELANQPIEEVLQSLDTIPDDKRTAVRNNGGGHYNHSLFWGWMSPDDGGEPDGDLVSAVNAAFGSFAGFQTKFKDAAVNQFGSARGVADLQRRGPRCRLVRQSRQPGVAGRHTASGHRRVRALLLPQVQQPASRLPSASDWRSP